MRALSKAPGVAILIVLTLGLGIGSSTLLFNMVRQWVWGAASFPHSDKLAVVWEIDTKKGYEGFRIRAQFQRLARTEPVFENLSRMGRMELQR